MVKTIRLVEYVHVLNGFRTLQSVYGEHSVARLVEALRCTPEGRGFDFRWCLGFIDIILPAAVLPWSRLSL